jgi:hypothetical protein
LRFNSRAQRLALAAGCHGNQPTKRNNVFKLKKALKRNVANRPLQALFGAIATSNCGFVLNYFELELKTRKSGKVSYSTVIFIILDVKSC